jgi:16S rRNA (cytidine1402-2'-O)-methyltransferase
MFGTLYIVATPIGNLEDVTLRALRVLKEVDVIACEDTRQTAKLLRRYGIPTPTISFHEHNERERTPHLIQRLKEGQSVALVSDAGTPVLSDPGLVLIDRALAEGISIVPIPGPSALTTALMAAGLPMERFLFVGFLPPTRSQRIKLLTMLRDFPYPLVLFEAPHRLRHTLEDLCEAWGNRPVVLAREMTKIHEEFLRTTLEDLRQQMASRGVRGEIVLVVSGAPPSVAQRGSMMAPLLDQVQSFITRYRLEAKTAARIVGDLHQVNANLLYREYVKSRSAKHEEA